MAENPVSDVVRVRDGQKIVVSSAIINIEKWGFHFIRRQGEPFLKSIILHSHQVYEPPPSNLKARAKERAEALFSEIRPAAHVHPARGVLIP